MHATAVLENAPDAVLIERARTSDPDAIETLWLRHRPAAVRFAYGLVGRTDAEDLVSEAFANIYQTLRNGGGPDALFRPYLFTCVKNLAIRWGVRESSMSLDDVDPDLLAGDGAVDSALALDRSMVAQVFRALPTRWQEVLWYTEVEQLRPQSVAPFLGMSANAVAALSHRAREGFRRAWLEAHHENLAIPAGCRRNIRELSRRTGATIPPRIALHMQSCPHCSTVTAEMSELSGRLRIVLVPLFLGTVGAAAFSQTIGAAPATAAVAAAAGTATGTIVSGILVGVGVLVALTGFGIVVPATAPQTAPAVDTPGSSVDAVAPSSEDPVPTAGPETPGPQSTDPATPVTGTSGTGTTPAGPGAPADDTAPAAPKLSAAIPAGSTGSPEVRGTGEPGATVTLANESGALGTTVVKPDGTWRFPAPSGLGPLDHLVRLTQTDAAGNTSPALQFSPDFVPTAVLLSATPVAAGDPVQFEVHGWQGASYRVYLDGVLLQTTPGKQTYTIGAGGVAAMQSVSGVGSGGHELTVGYVNPSVSGPPALFTNTHVEVAP
ncbi:MAG: sigma-70 family RNA polymerase sigma factor [Pseudolysinimonas sp.]